MSAYCRRLRLLVLALSLLFSTFPIEAQTSNTHDGWPRKLSIRIRDLGTLVPGGETSAAAINNRGHVVGWGSTLETIGGGARFVPFLWTPDQGFQGILPDELVETVGVATDINDHDHMVGTFTDVRAEGGPHGFLWTPNGGFVDLGFGFAPVAINNRGQIAGSCSDADAFDVEACLWENGVLFRLGGLLLVNEATGINERGHVTGFSLEEAVESGWVWKPHLGFVELPLSSTHAINNRGHILGDCHVVVSSGGGFIRRGPTGFCGRAINSRNWVAGTYFSEVFAAAVWRPTGQLTLLPGVSGEPSGATDINDRGQVTGNSLTAAGSLHAVVWTVRGLPRK